MLPSRKDLKLTSSLPDLQRRPGGREWALSVGHSAGDVRNTDGLSAAAVTGQIRRTRCEAAIVGAAPSADSRRQRFIYVLR